MALAVFKIFNGDGFQLGSYQVSTVARRVLRFHVIIMAASVIDV